MLADGLAFRLYVPITYVTGTQVQWFTQKLDNLTGVHNSQHTPANDLVNVFGIVGTCVWISVLPTRVIVVIYFFIFFRVH